MPKSQARKISVRINADASLVRTETIRDQEFLVTPSVLLVEGVLQPGNAGGAKELALVSEFGKVTSGWNGRPITVAHPQIDGEFVSANSPDMWDGSVIGMVFNARCENKKLNADLWINKAWMSESYSETLEKLSSGETIELSTGLFTDTEEASGIWNGEKYDGIWRNIVPDHLALLPNQVGACSVADGCGTARVNSKQVQQMQQARLNVLQETVESLKTSKSTESQECCMSTDKTKPMGALSRLVSFFSSFGEEKEGQQLLANASGISDNDVRSALQSTLSAIGTGYAYIMAVYDTYFVYESYDSDEGWKVYQRNYSIEAAGVITIGSDEIEVRPLTTFVPISVVVNESASDVEESASVETVTETIETASAKVSSDEVVNISKELTTESTELAESAETSEVTEPMQIQALDTPVSDVQTLVSTATSELQELVNDALAIRTQERARLIQEITQLKGNTFTETELSVIPTALLGKLALLGKKENSSGTEINYAGRSGPLVSSREADTNDVVPLPVFPRKKA